MERLHGVIPAVLTPFTASGNEVDVPALEAYVDWLTDHRVHGLFVCGTNGEGPALSPRQREAVVAASVRRARGKVPVLVQTGAISTEEAVEYTKSAREHGADGVAVVAPWYFPHDDEALTAHFATVARAAGDLPVYLYNIPGNAKNDLKPKLVKTLMERCPNVVGIKDSSKDLDRTMSYIQTLGPKATVIVGTDSHLLPALLMGGAGVVSAVGNCFPSVMVSTYEAWQRGDLAAAQQGQFLAIKAREALKSGPYIHPYKLALQWQGLPFGGMRPPLRESTPEEAAGVRAKLVALGLLGA